MIDFTKPRPVTIDGAIDRVWSTLTPEEINFIKTEGLGRTHRTVGMAMRNEWGMWEKNSPLITDMRGRFCLFGHADDCSGLIMEGVTALVEGRDMQKAVNTMALQYFQHWRKQGINPVTGKKIGKGR